MTQAPIHTPEHHSVVNDTIIGTLTAATMATTGFLTLALFAAAFSLV